GTNDLLISWVIRTGRTGGVVPGRIPGRHTPLTWPMNSDLGISTAAFGFATGIFSAGYIALQIPSNLALNKLGPRRWLGLLTIAWRQPQALAVRLPDGRIALSQRLTTTLATQIAPRLVPSPGARTRRAATPTYP
ncbi:hypothetical protein ACFV2U_31145, partial [Streptomyces sp. NPDC059697]